MTLSSPGSGNRRTASNTSFKDPGALRDQWNEETFSAQVQAALQETQGWNWLRHSEGDRAEYAPSKKSQLKAAKETFADELHIQEEAEISEEKLQETTGNLPPG